MKTATVDITQNIRNLIERNPEQTWDGVIEAIVLGVRKGFLHIAHKIETGPTGFVIAIEHVVGRVSYVSVGSDEVKVTVSATSGPYSGYFSTMVEKEMVKPEMFRLVKFGYRVALVLREGGV